MELKEYDKEEYDKDEYDKDSSHASANSYSWWSHPCGGHDVMQLALPMVISTGCLSVMLFVDRMLLLWHSQEAMAAALPAGMLYWTMVCFPFGVAQYVNTFVAQYHGARHPDRIGAVVWQGIYVAIFASPFFLAAAALSPYLFGWFAHEPLIMTNEVTYFRWLALGASAAVLNGPLSSFFIGRGKTQVVMYANILATIVNIGLDYILIFGLFGYLKWGIAGAAIATVVSQWFKSAIYITLMISRDHRRTFRLDRTRLDWPLMWRLLRFGGPNGMQMLVEAAGFSLIILFVGQLGLVAIGATTLAFNVNAVAFIPMVGVSIAVSTLVGQQLSAGHAELAARATWTSLGLGTVYSALFAGLCLLAPSFFFLGHDAGVNAAEFAEIRATTIHLLRFIAAYCLFDTVQIVFVGTLKGAGDTHFVLITSLVAAATSVSVGWYGVHYWGGGLNWWWCVITGWIISLALIYIVRFIQGHWREMLVIERKLVTNPESTVTQTY